MGRFKTRRGLFLPPYILSDDLKRTRRSANLICAPVGEQHGRVEKSTPISSRRADGGNLNKWSGRYVHANPLS